MSDKDLKPFMTTLYILWGAMCSSVLLFIVIVQVIQNEIPPEQAEEALNLFVPIFGVASMSVLATAFFLRNLLYFKKRDTMEQGARRKGYQTVSILSWSMAESIAIFGFVSSFLSGNPYVVFPFAALALAAMFAFLPRASHLTR